MKFKLITAFFVLFSMSALVSGDDGGPPSGDGNGGVICDPGCDVQCDAMTCMYCNDNGCILVLRDHLRIE